MVLTYYLTYKLQKVDIDEIEAEDLESLEIGVNEDHLKLGSWSIVYYRIFQICLMFHQVSHELLDPEKKDEITDIAEQIFFLASSMFLSGILMQILNVELLLSTILVGVYNLLICWVVYRNSAYQFMFMNFLQTAIIATPMFAFLCGAQINALRHGFEI